MAFDDWSFRQLSTEVTFKAGATFRFQTEPRYFAMGAAGFAVRAGARLTKSSRILR